MRVLLGVGVRHCGSGCLGNDGPSRQTGADGRDHSFDQLRPRLLTYTDTESAS